MRFLRRYRLSFSGWILGDVNLLHGLGSGGNVDFRIPICPGKVLRCHVSSEIVDRRGLDQIDLAAARSIWSSPRRSTVSGEKWQRGTFPGQIRILKYTVPPPPKAFNK